MRHLKYSHCLLVTTATRTSSTEISVLFCVPYIVMVILKEKSVIFQALLLSHIDDDGSKTHEKATERDRGKRNFFLADV